jgi:hypothetical protein
MQEQPRGHLLILDSLRGDDGEPVGDLPVRAVLVAHGNKPIGDQFGGGLLQHSRIRRRGEFVGVGDERGRVARIPGVEQGSPPSRELGQQSVTLVEQLSTLAPQPPQFLVLLFGTGGQTAVLDAQGLLLRCPGPDSGLPLRAALDDLPLRAAPFCLPER